jgi:hypothetical protein
MNTEGVLELRRADYDETIMKMAKERPQNATFWFEVANSFFAGLESAVAARKLKELTDQKEKVPYFHVLNSKLHPIREPNLVNGNENCRAR